MSEIGSKIEIQLLGKFAIVSGGRDVCPRGRKARGILAYLAAAQSRSATRECIAELFWGDRGEEQARGSLRQAVAEIRSSFGDNSTIVVSRDSVGLEPAAITTDIEEILHLAAVRDIPRLASRLEYLAGGFLDDLSGVAPAFDDWRALERVRQYDRLVSVTLEAAGMNGARNTADLLKILRVLDRFDPLNEAVARLGLRAAHASGDSASLHRQYRRLIEGLAAEFGTQPSTETRDLFHELTSIAAQVPSPQIAGLPTRRAPTMPPMILVSSLGYRADDDVCRDVAGMCTDDVRAALSRYPSIRVVALEALEADRVVSVCANALAAYMLSGRISRLDDELRINLQIGNIGSNVIIWSQQLRLPADTIAEAIDHIVAKAVGAVLPSVDRDLAERMVDADVDAGDLVRRYAKARGQVKTARTLANAQAGAMVLQEIISCDARHIGARMLLAQLYNTDFWQRMAGHDVRGHRAEAFRLVREAAAIQPGDAQIGIKLAWCHLRAGEWRLAERGLHAAVEGLPYDADGINECAFGFFHLGKLALAEQLMQRAFLLNPFPPTDYHADFAAILALRGEALEAEDHFEVSGEQGSQYLAIRLANITRLKGEDNRRRTLATAFSTAFDAAWQPARVARLGDIVEWLSYTLPMKLPEHAAFLRDGVQTALGGTYRA
ncbi:BTAD domain-containing putative transcriptional regulator [Sphingomonas qilianensis]|uniref:BTAD domain-containing putative transcriptional regulator n=1 Tax=Sphingomonas qilianensis TaxID=1736690 RepID=A0ABU9XWM7_9SPHN